MNTGSFTLMCGGQGIRTSGRSTYWIGDTRGMAVLATRATYDESDFKRRKRMATEQIGEPCQWGEANTNFAKKIPSRDLK
jgi:hypothetical protein